MTTNRSLIRGYLSAAVLALLTCSSGSHAAGDPVNGKLLYNDQSRGDGNACSGCHLADPTRNQSSVLNGSGQSAVIQAAIDNNTGSMGDFKGNLSLSELDDIAAYLSAVPGSTTSALNFGAVLNGTDDRTIALSNAGGVYFKLSAAEVTGAGAASFSVDVSACASATLGGAQTKTPATSSCEIKVRYVADTLASTDGQLLITGTAVNAKGQAIAATAQSFSLPLMGSVSAISLTPNQLQFTKIEDGHTYAGSSAVINAGGNAVTINDIVLSEGADHVQLATGPGYCNKGEVLEPGQQCLLAVMVNGPTSASVQLQTTAGNQSLSVTAELAPVNATVSSVTSAPVTNDGAGGCAIVGATADFDPILALLTLIAGAASVWRRFMSKAQSASVGAVHIPTTTGEMS